jgi:DNA polymerase III subunit epsilon
MLEMPAEALTLRSAALRGPVACVDLETTGGMAAHHRIIEVGIVLLEDGRVVEEWNSLVQPGIRIPSAIAAFTGIDDSMVADAPRFEDIRGEVRRRLAGRLFVAHNARFDYGFLRTEFRRLGERFAAPVLCTVRLSRTLFAEHRRHNLDTLIERFGLSCNARHRALGDAQVLPALLGAMEEHRGESVVHDAVTAALRELRLPPQLPPELADELPEGPGVYLFRGEGGALLYVGKGRNIRSRVFEHFAGAHRSAKDARLAQQVQQVEWRETGGELGALLLESRLVKDLAPSGNRRLRKSTDDCAIALVQMATGLQPEIVALEAAASTGAAVLCGPFHAEKDAWRAIKGKAREAGLCLKAMGRETGEGSCFAYQLGKCRGTCIGKEPRALHDARMQLAFASLRIQPWPFGGPIGIRESSPDANTTWLHVVDRWQHLGTARDDSEVEALLCAPRSECFDADSYRIVGRCLKTLRAQDLVVFDRPRHA